MKNIAVIPARSGSKGVKDKNIRILDGKPMIAYSIEAAIQSELFDEVYVSTDSQKYADIAKNYGACVPFLRNKELAEDGTGSWGVVKAVVEKYKFFYNKIFDTVTLLQPTSPLRTKEDIQNGYKLMHEKNATTIVGVEKTGHSPEEYNILPESLSMNGFVKEEHVQIQRQKLDEYYRINGALYITKIKQLDYIDDLYNNNCFAYIMPSFRSVDIDSELDISFAELLLQKMKMEK